MSLINNKCSCSGLDWLGLSSSFAALISQNTSEEDLIILAAFFTTLGDNLALIATAKSIFESNK